MNYRGFIPLVDLGKNYDFVDTCLYLFFALVSIQACRKFIFRCLFKFMVQLYPWKLASHELQRIHSFNFGKTFLRFKLEQLMFVCICKSYISEKRTMSSTLRYQQLISIISQQCTYINNHNQHNTSASINTCKVIQRHFRHNKFEDEEQ